MSRPLAFVLALIASGCVETLDEEGFSVERTGAAPIVSLATVISDCEHHGPWQESGPSPAAAIALTFPQGTYWIFRHSIPNRLGADWISHAGATAARVATGCGELEHLTDESGRPVAVLPLTAAEADFNARDEEGASLAVFPWSGFVHEERGYVFYLKLLITRWPASTVIGTGVAELRYGEPAVRLEPSRYSEEPTLLWLYPQSYFGSAAYLDDDGRVYVYGWYDLTSFVARVPVEGVGDPSGYRYFDGADWSERLEDAVSTGAEAPLAPIRLAALDRYVSPQSELHNVALEGSAHPWGPYASLPTPLFDAGGSTGGIQLRPGYDAETVLASYLDGGVLRVLTLRLR